MCRFIEFFGQRIAMFPFFTGIGILTSAFFIFHQLKRMGASADHENLVMPAIPFTFIAGVIGGYIADVILRGGIEALFTNPFGYGLTFYGWLTGGIFFLLIYSRICGLKHDWLLNLFLPSFALAQAFGRIGCFCGGCCYGKPSSFGVCYPAGSLPYIHHGPVPLAPVQLYESLYLFTVFALIVKYAGFKQRGAWYLLLVSAGRFFLEFLRDDDRGTLFVTGLSPSQVISLILFFIGMYWLIKVTYREKNHVRNSERKCE